MNEKENAQLDVVEGTMRVYERVYDSMLQHLLSMEFAYTDKLLRQLGSERLSRTWGESVCEVADHFAKRAAEDHTVFLGGLMRANSLREGGE